jgi:hypothetical protein
MPVATDRRGIGELVRDVAEDSAALARKEIHLLRVELSEIVRGIGKGAAMMIAAAALGIVGIQIFVFGLVLLLGGEILRGRYWLAAFLTTAVFAVLAVVLVKRGMAALTPRNMLPDQSMESLKEDKEWLKQQTRSVTISK